MADAGRGRAPAGERHVIDVLDTAVIVTGVDGAIQLWSNGAARLYGWTESEVVGRSIIDVLAPIDERAVNTDDFAVVRSGRGMAGDRRVRRRDGVVIRVQTFTQSIKDDRGEVIAIVGSSWDVGEQRRVEQRGRDLTEHFRAALEAGGLGTWCWDMTSGSTVWDERLETLFGLEHGSFDGSFETYVGLLHPDDRDDVLRTIEEALNEKSTYRVEHRVVMPDGTIRWLQGVGGVTVDDVGEVTGTVGCSMDVTQRVERERERERLTDLAVEAAGRERLQRERLEFVAAINKAINEATSVREIMTRATAVAVPRLGDWCSLYILPELDGGIPDIEVAHVDPAMVTYAEELRDRFPYDPDAPAGVPAVIRSGRTEYHADISGELLDSLDIPDELRDIVRHLDLRSSITVPLKRGRKTIGAMQFVASNPFRQYTQDDVALAETVAGRIATGVENLRLHENQRHIAQTLQRSLLPSSLPSIPGIDLAVRYWPSGGPGDVGGDFYDVFDIDGAGRWAVVIGDVCGTGPSAAASTSLARHSIRGSVWHGDAPTDVLTHLNTALLRSDNRTFLTCAFGILDLNFGAPTMTVVCGGHPLPVHVGADGATAVGRPGTLLGMLEHVESHPVDVMVASGDVLVFYTDGATDVPAPNFLESDDFASLIGQAAEQQGSADAIANRIHTALDSVVPLERRRDDIALVVLRAE